MFKRLVKSPPSTSLATNIGSRSGWRARAALLLRERGQLQLADALHVRRAESRVLQDVREKLDGLRQRFTQRVHADVARLVACARGKLDGEIVQLSRKLRGGARPGAFGRHAGHETGQAALAPLLAVDARAEEDVERDDGNGVQLGHEHARA